MNLAFCIYKYFPYGGIQRDLMKMVRECQHRGHAVRVYVINWNAPAPDEIEVVLAPVSALTNHRLYERFASWVRDHLNQHPVDLVVGMNKMPGLDVYYAGDSCYEYKARSQRSALYRLLPRYRSFAAAEKAVFEPSSQTRILAISDSQIPYFRRFYGTPESRFHLLPPGIDRDRIAPGNKADIRKRVREREGVGEDEYFLLFVGSGFIKKGLDRALLGLAALPHRVHARTRMVVIGQDNAEPFKRLARRLGVDDRVTFFAGRDDIPDFMFAADGLVLPAYDENAGMVIIESMIAGLPALVTAECGYAHYLSSADAGLIAQSPFDQQVFNTQILELLTSPERSRWIENGQAIAANDEIYRLVPQAVDLLEQFAERNRTLAFCLFKFFSYGGLQRDFLKVALEAQRRGYAIRVYVENWDGDVPQGFDVQIMPGALRRLTNHRTHEQYIRWVSNRLRWSPASLVIGFNRMPSLDVYYAADSCFEERAQRYRSRLYRFTTRYRSLARFERAVFRRGVKTRILLITDIQRDDFQRHYHTEDERMVLLPPGVGRDRCRPADALRIRTDFRDDVGLAEHDLLLLLIGSGFITKGLDRAIRALAALPDDLRSRCRFMIIGLDRREQFMRLAENLAVDDRVEFLSGRDDVPRFLLGADVMIHPALVESGGIVLLEAMIAGLPVIVTDTCGFAHYVADADAGVVLESPFDQQMLNETLTSALQDPSRRQCWADNGISFGREADLFSMAERAVDHIEAALDE